MNLKQAKRLRKKLGYHPSAPRSYRSINPKKRPILVMNEEGKQVPVMITTVTHILTGIRREYQQQKRTYNEHKIL